jgi:hypothetical protein
MKAVRHAMRVASGLDSMALGETQILGQMKNAVRAASEAGAMGTYLNQMFQRTFSVAKEVRDQTEIGAHSVSMAAAAVRLAQRIFDEISSLHVERIAASDSALPPDASRSTGSRVCAALRRPLSRRSHAAFNVCRAGRICSSGNARRSRKATGAVW